MNNQGKEQIITLEDYTIYLNKPVGKTECNVYEAIDEDDELVAAKLISTADADQLFADLDISTKIKNRMLLYSRDILIDQCGNYYLITDLATKSLNDLIIE